MSNIRGIGDLRAPPPAQPFPRINNGNVPPRQNAVPVAEQQNVDIPEDDEMNMAFLPPRSVFPPMSELLCPKFTPMSFTFLVSLIQLVMFLVALIVGAALYDGAFVPYNQMGGPSSKTFIALGAKFLPLIRQGQIWRFLAPVFLHAGILHLAGNLFFQCRMGFVLEQAWGWSRFATLYLLAGLGASLFSCVTTPLGISVGASGALFGLLGGEIAWLIMSWQTINSYTRNQEMCTCVTLIIVNFLLGSLDPVIDNYAHLGGLLFGFVAAGSLLTPVPGQVSEGSLGALVRTRIFVWISTVLLGSLFLILLLVAFLTPIR